MILFPTYLRLKSETAHYFWHLPNEKYIHIVEALPSLMLRTNKLSDYYGPKRPEVPGGDRRRWDIVECAVKVSAR